MINSAFRQSEDRTPTPRDDIMPSLLRIIGWFSFIFGSCLFLIFQGRLDFISQIAGGVVLLSILAILMFTGNRKLLSSPPKIITESESENIIIPQVESYSEKRQEPVNSLNEEKLQRIRKKSSIVPPPLPHLPLPDATSMNEEATEISPPLPNFSGVNVGAVEGTKLAKKLGTKSALNISLVGWVILCFAALSFAPLEYSQHSDYQVQLDEDAEAGVWQYTPNANLVDFPIAQVENGDEQNWALNHLLSVGIVEIDEDYSDAEIYKWAGFDDDNEPVYVSLGAQTSENIDELINSFEDTRFSVSVVYSDGSESTKVGVDHPTNLGDGVIDVIPSTVRSNVWGPLGISIGLQFLILGCAMGTLLGGSQGLARSMFGQMVPETRSAEFFGFFGFFGKVAAFIGPLLYGIMTVMYDSRVGILSIAMLILIGAVMMRMVDLEQGRLDAQAEDARNRGIHSED